MNRTVVFRVDGGNVYSIAMGHLYRCLRLARLLKQRGVDCLFVMKNYPEGVALAREAGMLVKTLDISIPPEDESEWVVSFAASLNAVLFIDLRKTLKKLVSRAFRQGLSTIVYEDDSREDIEPDLLINPTLNTHAEKNYQSKKRTQYLLGLEYLVLDPEIGCYKRDLFSKEIHSLFLCFGGADPCNISSRAVNILLERNDTFNIDMVLGPAFSHMVDMERTIKANDCNGRVTVIRNCKQLAPLHARADAALTSGGTIAYESVALAVPTLVLPTIRQEAETAATLMGQGLLAGISRDVSKIDDSDLANAVDQFIMDSAKRERLFKAAAQFDLTGGALRVVKKLDSVFLTNSMQL